LHIKLPFLKTRVPHIDRSSFIFLLLRDVSQALVTDVDALVFYDVNMQRTVALGLYDIMLTPSSDKLQALSVEVK